MPRSLNMNLYLRAFSITIYQKLDLYYLCLFRFFSGLQIGQFWSLNYFTYFRPSWICGQCWYWKFLVLGISKGSASILSYFFSCFFLGSKLCKSGLYIIKYFKHGKYFIWVFLVFCTFWRLKLLILWRKIVENLLIFVYLFCPKNRIDFTKTFTIELPDLSLNHIFNALLIGVQYTLLFQITNFGLKCLIWFPIRIPFPYWIPFWYRISFA